MFETMQMAAGVSMGEGGKSKAGPQTPAKRQMSRKEYLSMCNPVEGNSSASNTDLLDSTATPTSFGAALGGNSRHMDEFSMQSNSIVAASLPSQTGSRSAHSMPPGIH